MHVAGARPVEPPELPSSHYGPWPCVPSRAALSVHARADLCLSTTLRAPSASGCGIEDCATRLRLYAALTLYRLLRAHVAPSRAPILDHQTVCRGARRIATDGSGTRSGACADVPLSRCPDARCGCATASNRAAGVRARARDPEPSQTHSDSPACSQAFTCLIQTPRRLDKATG